MGQAEMMETEQEEEKEEGGVRVISGSGDKPWRWRGDAVSSPHGYGNRRFGRMPEITVACRAGEGAASSESIHLNRSVWQIRKLNG